MKKRHLYSTAVAIVVVSFAYGGFGATVAIGNQSGIPGFGFAALPVTLTLDAGDQVAGAEWETTFDSTMLKLYSVLTGPAATAAGKTVTYSALSPGRIRIVIAGLNLDTMSDGVLASLVFTVSPSAPSGPQPVLVDQLVLTNPFGVEVESAATPGILSLSREMLPVGPATIFGKASMCLVIVLLGLYAVGRRDIERCA